MKVPQPDINKITMDTFVAKTGANRKLLRLWGTTTSDTGVKILNPKRHYYKAADRPDNYEKLFKFLGTYKEVEEYEGEGIEKAWFFLNKSNGPENDELSTSFVTNNLNSMWWDDADGVMPNDLTLTTSIVIEENYSGNSSLTGVDLSLPKEELAQFIIENYETLWATKKITQEGVGVINKGTLYDEDTKTERPDNDDLTPDDNWLAILSRYVLRDSGIPCTIKDVESGLGRNGLAVYSTLVVTIEIPYYNFSNQTELVKEVMRDLENNQSVNYRSGSNSINGFVHNNVEATQKLAKTPNSADDDEKDVSVVTRQYIQWEDSTVSESVYENFWVKHKGVWCFKADVIENPKAYGTTHIELNSYLFGLFDTGYKKEKVPFWKKIIAVIIFVVAVVITYVSGGTTSGWTGQLMAAAYAVIVGSLVITLATFVFSALGMVEWATAFASVSKAIAPLTTVASVFFVVTSIYVSYQAAAAAAVEEGLKHTVVDHLITIATDMFAGFVEGFADILAGSFTTTPALKSLNFVIERYTISQNNKLEEINNKNQDLKAEYDKLVEEGAMEEDVFRSYMNIYARPATADWSMYALKYDVPYERGGGLLATGNIQKTTKQAMRKADYNEPMFDSLIFV